MIIKSLNLSSGFFMLFWSSEFLESHLKIQLSKKKNFNKKSHFLLN